MVMPGPLSCCLPLWVGVRVNSAWSSQESCRESFCVLGFCNVMTSAS